jgi:hypothetical protein
LLPIIKPDVTIGRLSFRVMDVKTHIGFREADSPLRKLKINSKAFKDLPICVRTSHEMGDASVIVQRMWSPTGMARACAPKCASARRRGTLLHAQVGRHPGQTLAHSSTGKVRGLLLPG